MESVNSHKDLQSCTSMAVNISGSLALLAGRRAYGLVELDQPSVLRHKESRHSKWEVSTSEFSREESLVAVASNNKIDLVRWREGELAVETTLRGHTRVVTDLSWHYQDHNLLATSSTDTYIYVWDKRDSRRPVNNFQAVAGATKIQWNKVSGKLLASAHEGQVKLWDVRMGSPVQYINAHLSKIYGLDWSWDDEDHLVTSSQDSTVKFWSITNPGKADNIINIALAPVWKVRYTPFGDGLLTLVMHTLLRGENNLMLWDRTDLRSPVHTFYGHSDMVLEFGWKHLDTASRYQLVTWSKDSTLRLWNIDADLQRQVGQEVEDCEEKTEDEDILNIVAGAAAGETIRDEYGVDAVEMSEIGDKSLLCDVAEEDIPVVIASPMTNTQMLRRPNHLLEDLTTRSSHNNLSSSISDLSSPINKKSMNLNYEFSLINVSDKLIVERMDAKERTFTVSAETGKSFLVLNVKFPPNYPNQTAPIFSFLHGTTIDAPTRSQIIQKLKTVSRQQISRNRRCLESCLRVFEASVENIKQNEEELLQSNNLGLSSTLLSPTAILGAFQDHNIPFPRSSGARFCGDGNLVCFGRTRHYTVKVTSTESNGQGATKRNPQNIAKTPRALSSWSALSNMSGGGATSPKYSLSMYGQSPQDGAYFPFKARVPRVRFSTQKSRISVTSMSSDDYNKMGSGYSHLENRKYSDGTRPIQGTVTIYDCSSILPYCKDLADLYLLPNSPGASGMSIADICSHNANVALQVGRKDLIQVWSLAALLQCGVTVKDHGNMTPWAVHPFGRSLLEDILSHYEAVHDIQTVAMISCIFGNKVDTSPRVRKKASKSESCDIVVDVLYSNLIKHNRSNSDTQNHDDCGGSMCSEDEETLYNDSKLLDPARNDVYDTYIEAYSNLLHTWRMIDKRTEVAKCLSESRNNYDKFVCNISVDCKRCGHLARGPCCAFCHRMLLVCSVCRVSCRGLTTLCSVCGHGGHTRHLRDWFSGHGECPTGCGCNCPQVNPWID